MPHSNLNMIVNTKTFQSTQNSNQNRFFFNWDSLHAFTPRKPEQQLQGMELQEKEAQKDSSIQEISSERPYS